MKKQLCALALAAGLGLSSWGTAQGGLSDPLEQKKAQHEIQVMTGILQTTLEFVANELRNRESASGKSEGQNSGWKVSHFSTPDVSSFYLYGQGVTFIIPISSLRGAFVREGRLASIGELPEPELAAALDEASRELAAAGVELAANKEQVELAVRQATDAALQATLVPPPPPPPPPAPVASSGKVSSGASSGTARGQGQATPPARPTRSAGDQEQLRKKLAEAQAKVKKSREEMDAQRQKLMQSISEIKVYLIEALANHGDSLTFLKPGEYINIVITTDERFPMYFEHFDGGQRRSPREVLSVQKSVITDYKAGRLNLDALKQKVLQYTT